MAFGIVEYDVNGNPICEICGKSFKRVIAHVRQIHEMSEREYKEHFGFDLKKGICSKESSELSRDAVVKNYDKVISNLSKGDVYRFKKGHKGRTSDQVSEQTRIALKAHVKSEKMILAAKENCRKLGLSGLGNKKRWKK